MFALWRVARPAIEALAAERGVPLALHDYAELGLGALSVAEARRRDPYSRPEGFAAEFARLEAGGWLARTEGASGAADARYAVLPRAREAVRALGEAGDARLGALAAMPEADLARLHGLLAAVAAACLAAPEPPRRWASERRFRTADARTPLAGRVREAALDCLAYRDDAHLEAWRGHADPEAADPEAEGALWNAFTRVRYGEARTAEAIARAAAFRGYGAADYARALASLEARGWVAAEGGGAYAATAAGRALRDAVGIAVARLHPVREAQDQFAPDVVVSRVAGFRTDGQAHPGERARDPHAPVEGDFDPDPVAQRDVLPGAGAREQDSRRHDLRRGDAAAVHFLGRLRDHGVVRDVGVDGVVEEGLDGAPANAFDLNGGTVTSDVDGATATTITYGAVSTAVNVDGSIQRAPRVANVYLLDTQSLGAGSFFPIPASLYPGPATGNTLGLGERFVAAVEFEAPVTVTGSPQLKLTVGSTGRLADLFIVVWDTLLYFNYVVQASDRDTDGIPLPPTPSTSTAGPSACRARRPARTSRSRRSPTPRTDTCGPST